jgi:hypothetical protein
LDESLVKVDDSEPWWCFGHLGDDWLPSVVAGVVSQCVSCGLTSVTWQVDGLDAPVCLHERCRRALAMSTVVVEHQRGAWARRSAAAVR